jgi:hypothetical protein
MSWTQGVIPREEVPQAVIDALEAGYERLSGKPARLEYLSWHEIDQSDLAAFFDDGNGMKVGKK